MKWIDWFYLAWIILILTLWSLKQCSFESMVAGALADIVGYIFCIRTTCNKKEK